MFQDWKMELFVALPILNVQSSADHLMDVSGEYILTVAFWKITGIDMSRTNKSFVEKKSSETARDIKTRNYLKRMYWMHKVIS